MNLSPTGGLHVQRHQSEELTTSYKCIVFLCFIGKIRKSQIREIKRASERARWSVVHNPTTNRTSKISFAIWFSSSEKPLCFLPHTGLKGKLLTWSYFQISKLWKRLSSLTFPSKADTGFFDNNYGDAASTEGEKWFKQNGNTMQSSLPQILRNCVHLSTYTCFCHIPTTVRRWLFFPLPVTLHQSSGPGSAHVKWALAIMNLAWGAAIGYENWGWFNSLLLEISSVHFQSPWEKVFHR
jgi:hypothetical protein